MQNRKKILVAPLNWGLGHASRCVPVIHELIAQDAEVLIAADGGALQLIRKEFPQLKWFKLEGYSIRYWWNLNAVFQIVLQLPGLFLTFYNERKWLKRFIEKENIDAIISDNRYGLFSGKIDSVLITHQTCIQLPNAFRWMEKYFYRLNKKIIGRFSECWIPDDNDPGKSLSGNLSHQFPLPQNACFIGSLSRFHYGKKSKQYDLLIVISGPENQRTKFEELITQQAVCLDLKIQMVRGIPESNKRVFVKSNFLKIDYMTAKELNLAFLSSEIIIARSGYSTIMDLAATGSKAVLIPTRGQTEQEYLAEFLIKKKICYSESQKQFDLVRSLKRAEAYTGFKLQSGNSILKERVKYLLD